MTHIFAAVADATSAAPEDWVARGMALIGYVLTALTFTVSYRGKLWRGRAVACEPLRGPFGEIRDVIAASEQSPLAAQQLWAAPIGLAMEELSEAARRLPDPKLSRLLVKFVAQARVARGATPPTTEEAEAPRPMSAKQLKSARDSSITATEIEDRLNKSAKKGAHGG